MIQNNLSGLMGERLLKIPQVAADTEIPPYVLRLIQKRKAKTISFEVIDKLCNYLNCGVEDLIKFTPDDRV